MPQEPNPMLANKFLLANALFFRDQPSTQSPETIQQFRSLSAGLDEFRNAGQVMQNDIKGLQDEVQHLRAIIERIENRTPQAAGEEGAEGISCPTAQWPK